MPIKPLKGHCAFVDLLFEAPVLMITLSLLNIRFLQIKRALKDGGIGSILLPFFILGLSYVSYKAYQNQIYGTLLFSLLVIICLSLQVVRKDKSFAQMQLPQWHFQMFMEYVMLTLPFSATALFSNYFYYFPLYLILLWFVPYLKYKPVQKTIFKSISKLFPSAFAIEWISGFRKSFLTLIPLYAIAVGACWVRILPLFMLWLITTVILSFYTESEPTIILRANHTSAKQFLNEKIKKHGLYIACFYAPVLIVNSFFNPDFVSINLLFLLIQITLVIFGVSLKYSSYVPNQINQAANTTFSIVSIGSIIPFMLPLPIIFALVYYKKALQNLTYYFHDTD